MSEHRARSPLGQLNVQLAQALGVNSLEGVTRVVLTIEPNEWPTVRTIRAVLPGPQAGALLDRLHTVTDVHQLRPVLLSPDSPAAPPAAS